MKSRRVRDQESPEIGEERIRYFRRTTRHARRDRRELGPARLEHDRR